MNIGVDIDGVLNHFYKEYYNFILKNFNLKIDITKYDNNKFLKNKLGDYFNTIQNNFNMKDLEVEPFAKFFIKKLKRKNNIYIITARKSEESLDTINWLNKNGIVYDDIFFNSGNKGDICSNLNVDFMIDDAPHNIFNLLKNNINTIVFNRPYNQGFYNGNLVYVANNWIDIYNYLKNKN